MTANERDAARFRVLRQRCTANGARVELLNCDAFALLNCLVPGRFTCILLDPSCSGSGTVDVDRRLARRAAPVGDLRALTDFQRRLLAKTLCCAAVARVQLVCYSTCSIYAAENEDVVRACLDA